MRMPWRRLYSLYMKQTKKLTLCAVLVALGAAVMIIGAVIDVLDLTVCAFASLLMVFVYLEIGSPYTYLVWICTTLSTAIMYSASILWVEYFFVFGIYPILKGYFERLPRPFWLVVKLAFINAVIALIYLICELLFSIPFFNEGSLIMNAVLCVLINVAFVAYDMFITVMVKFYVGKIRPRIAKFLK